MVSLLSRNGTWGFLNARALTTFPTLKAGYSWAYSRGSAESINNILAIINNSTHWSSMLNYSYRQSSPLKVVKGRHFNHLAHLLRLFKLSLWGLTVGLPMLQNFWCWLEVTHHSRTHPILLYSRISIRVPTVPGMGPKTGPCSPSDPTPTNFYWWRWSPGNLARQGRRSFWSPRSHQESSLFKLGLRQSRCW